MVITGCNSNFEIENFDLDCNGDPKMKLSWSKAVKDYRLRKLYVEKTYNFRHQLLSDILDRAMHTTLDYKTKRVSSAAITST